MNIDIRSETYLEGLRSLLTDIDENIEPVGDPAEEIACHGLTGRESVDTAAYPAETWFLYPGDGKCYVRGVE